VFFTVTPPGSVGVEEMAGSDSVDISVMLGREYPVRRGRVV
jgi:hypothetical protein